MKHLLSFIFTCILLLATNTNTLAADFTSVSGGGNWNAPASWTVGGFTTTSTPGTGDNVFIQSGHTINIVVPSTQINNITINGGTLEIMMGRSLNITGNLINNSGNFTAGTGTTVTFSGGNAQIMSGTTNFVNLIIDKTLALPVNETVSINNTLTVTGTLTLTDGLLVLNANLQLTGTLATQLAGTGFSATKCIVINGTNNFARTGVTGSGVLFPIGTNGAYTPITLDNVIGNSDITVSLRQASPTEIAGFGGNCVNYIWGIDVGSSITADVRVEWGVSDVTGFFTPSNLPFLYNFSSIWIPAGLFGTFGTNTFTATSVMIPTTLTEFAVFAPTIPSPVVTYTTLASTTWNASVPPTNWSTDGGVTDCGCSPAEMANVIVVIKHNVTITTGTPFGANNSVILDAGGTLQFNEINSSPIILNATSTAIAPKIIMNVPPISGQYDLPNLDLMIPSNFFSNSNSIIEFGHSGTGTIPDVLVPYQNLIISGTGTKTLSDNTEIEGNLIVNSAGFNTSSFDMTIGGNVTNTGTFTTGTGNIIFEGRISNTGNFVTGAGSISVIGNLLNDGTFTTGTGPLTVKSNFTNEDIFNAGDSIDMEGGNFTNNDTFNANSGTVEFSGGNTQIIRGVTTFNNLKIDKPLMDVVSINNNAVIGGTLTLASGKLIANNASITLTNTASPQITSSSTSYVVTTGTGKLIRNGLATSASHLFPIGTIIGTLAEYAPVTISGLPTAGIRNFSVSVAPAGANLGGATVFAPYIWNISTENTLNNLGFNFEWLAPISVANTAKVQKRVGTNPWEIQITPTTNLNNFSAIPVELRGNEDTQFAVFTTPATLSVPNTDIKYFDVTDDYVGFLWKIVAGATSYEVQTGTINENTNNIDWVSVDVAVLTANSVTNNAAQTITYQNKNIMYDVTTYYRVRARGTTNSLYSAFVSIFISSINNPTTAINSDISKQITISPNPAKDSFIIDKLDNVLNQQNFTFILSDMTGKVILTETATQGLPYKMSLADVAKGLYFVKIISKEGIIIKKIIKE